MAKKPTDEAPAVDTRGEITLPIGEVEYVLRPSFAAIQAIERLTGRTLFDLADLATQGRLSLDDLGIICAEMMHAYGRANPDDPQITTYRGAKAETISGLVYEAGAPRITARITVLLMGALTGGYTASGEARAATTN